MGRPLGSKNKKGLDIYHPHPNDSPDEIHSAPTCKATLKLLGRTYTGEGQTPEEAFSKIEPGNWAKGAGVLAIETDGVVKEKVIAANHIRNIFGMTNGTRKQISLKWVSNLF